MLFRFYRDFFTHSFFLSQLNHLLIIFYNFFRGHLHVGINPPFDCFAKARGKKIAVGVASAIKVKYKKFKF